MSTTSGACATPAIPNSRCTGTDRAPVYRHSDPNVVNKFLFYITRCSLYGEYLPVEDRIPLPPWDKRSTRRTHVGSGGAVLVNRTPAIDNATMEVLWARGVGTAVGA